jgi:hypothetical protein
VTSEILIARRKYVFGLSREARSERLVSHLYRGNFQHPGLPMCPRGWNRDGGTAYSIWRGQSGRGICAVCVKRAEKKLAPIPAKPGVLMWAD